MAVTITSHRVVPFTFLFLNIWAIERYIEVDGVEVSRSTVAVFLNQTDAVDALTSLPQYATLRTED